MKPGKAKEISVEKPEIPIEIINVLILQILSRA
jgi:hypothetical protein